LYGVSNKTINRVRGLTVVGNGRGLWSGYKTIKSAGLTAGTKVGAITTLFDVTGAGGLGNSLIQLENGANVFGLSMAVLEVTYALGSAAGALGDVIGDL
jgi:D-arabinose 1-dehydrogenase-like Zn-dependent alcohol dehydrogenase